MPLLNHSILEAALVGLQAQKTRIEAQIAEIRSMLPGSLAKAAATPESTPGKRREFSAATKRKMRESQRARWAAVREKAEPAPATAPAKPKRKMSAAGRKAIIEATKKRWARFRAEAAKASPKKIAKKVAVKKAAPAKAAKKTAKTTAPDAAQAATEEAAE
jgi:hypothetical protein